MRSDTSSVILPIGSKRLNINAKITEQTDGCVTIGNEKRTVS